MRVLSMDAGVSCPTLRALSFPAPGIVLFLVLSLVAAAVPPVVTAGSRETHPRIALHLGPHDSKASVDCGPWTLPCSEFATGAAPGSVADIYLVLAGGDSIGFAGLSCGLQYDDVNGSGVDVLAWTFCGDWEFPNYWWPESGAGSRMVWNFEERCQKAVAGNDGVHALAGVFYVYAYGADTFAITPHPYIDPPELQVADCENNIYMLDESTDAGKVQFAYMGNVLGYNPCTGTGTPPVSLPPSPPPPPPPPPDDDDPQVPTEPQEAAILLHIGAADVRLGCSGAPTAVEDIVTAADAASEGLPYYVYVLGSPKAVARRSDEGVAVLGLSGLRFGIEYDTGSESGIQVLGWQSCAGSALMGANWPQSGSGITLLWAPELGCRRNSLNVAGFFQVFAYSPAVMSVTPFPGSGAAQYATCSASEQEFAPMDIHRVGWLSMGGATKGLDADGCNPLLEPCNGPVAVEPTTWGRLKTRFTTGP